MAEHALRETLTTHELAVSNMISIEALVRVMMRKDVVSERDILDAVGALKFEMGQKPRGEV